MDKLSKTANVFVIVMSIMVISAIAYTGIIRLQSYYKWQKRERENINYNYRSDLISREKADANLKSGIEEQIIVYNELIVIDSVKQIYIIPVTQKTLGDIESGNRDRSGYGTSGGSGDPRNRPVNTFRPYYFGSIHSYNGIFNNLIMYDSKNNFSECLFNTRIALIDFVPVILNNKRKLFILASTDDTNKDSVINKDDLITPFLYDFEKREIEKLEEKNRLILDYKYIRETEDVFLSVAIDKNGNNTFDFKNEPNVLEKYDKNLNKFVPVVNDSLSTVLQNLVNGYGK